jgi:uncharacterized C2H2 Zn-finger protein
MEDTFNEPLIPSQVESNLTCAICYEVLTTSNCYSHHNNKMHEFHRECVSDYFKVVIDNN